VNKQNDLNVNFKIPSRTKRQHAARVFETPAFILDIYLLRLKMHCVGSTAIMWSVKVFIIYFTLTCWREKKVLSSSHIPTCT